MIANKSIIRHILSQLRIGMDLTRFTLPAFLLAPRSTLEMYASLFGRPNMLTAYVKAQHYCVCMCDVMSSNDQGLYCVYTCRVTDQPTPRDRMIAAVKWFLGSLSASRRVSICHLRDYNYTCILHFLNYDFVMLPCMTRCFKCLVHV